jgi:drug/metabolite transporter (DMT)-like permease
MSLFVKYANSASLSSGSGTLSSLTTIFLRTAPSLPFIFLWCYLEKESFKKVSPVKLSVKDLLWLNLRGIIGTFSMICVFYGNIHLPLGTSVMLYNTNPFFLTLFAPLLLSEKMNKKSLAWALLGFLFVGILMGDSIKGEFELWDAGITLGGGLFSAMAYSSIKQLSRLPSSWVIMSLTSWGMIISMFSMPALPETRETLLWAAASSVPALVGQIFLTKAYQKGNAQIIAPAQYFGPVAATFLGVILLNESLTVQKVIGSLGIVSCGIALPLIKWNKKKRTGIVHTEITNRT